ncbi:MAG: hypothetical protein NZ455_14770 [Bacteroidia bacterium]|nr:hypothetical protein [Bacteroidia bacterium]
MREKKFGGCFVGFNEEIVRITREACGGRASARCEAQRSTEAIAQPAARRPEAQRRDTPKIKPCSSAYKK